MRSASSVGGVAVGGEQQGDMVVLLSVAYFEDDFDVGVQACWSRCA